MLDNTKQGSLLLLAVLTLTVISTIGCGDGRPDRVLVSGTVLLDGKALPMGQIVFVPEDGGRPSASDIDSSGRFSLATYEDQEGVIVGRHRVKVHAVKQISLFESDWLAPRKYANIETSGLEVEITAPTDTLKIELSSK